MYMTATVIIRLSYSLIVNDFSRCGTIVRNGFINIRVSVESFLLYFYFEVSLKKGKIENVHDIYLSHCIEEKK